MTDEQIAEASREQLVEQLLWSEGGASWGVCAVGNMVAAVMTRQEIKSCVTVQGDPADYTDEELRKLVKFSRDQSAVHVRVCGNILSSDNLYILRKEKSSWLSKRRSWEFGRMYSPSLDDAIHFLGRGI